MARKRKPPGYLRHKGTNQARVVINGQHHYLGEYGSPESLQRYNKMIEEWIRSQEPGTVRVPERPTKSTTKITDLFIRYAKHVDGYYPKESGEATAIKQVIREARSHTTLEGRKVGDMLAAEFGPGLLKEIRESWVERGLARAQINKMTGRLVRVFRWGVSEELVDASVYEALRTVDGLQRGRTTAPDREPVGPVSDKLVDATLPRLHEPIRSMVQLQRLTGMRPGEVCALHWGDIDTTGDVWVAVLGKHKTRHRNKRRVVLFGPKAKALLGDPGSGYVFSPKPSAKGKNKESVGKCYRERSYRQAIARACNREIDGKTLPSWFPHQIRHSVATEIRKRYGVEASRIILGHSTLNVTEVYAERDMQAAVEIAREMF